MADRADKKKSDFEKEPILKLNTQETQRLSFLFYHNRTNNMRFQDFLRKTGPSNDIFAQEHLRDNRAL